ncbi:MAG TPA: cytochrome c biogenesis protein CcdA [bacterium]|nr:cytochrome c biogenesis protein CcdA [bacterium]
MDIILLWFGFTGGLLTFFSPCSIPLLPGYIAFIVGKDRDSKKGLRTGLGIGLSASLGFFLVFLILGSIVAFISKAIAVYLSWVSLATGILIIILGILMFLELDSKLSFSSKLRFGRADKKGFVSYFLYGVVYSISALGCVFPIFLATTFQALNQGGTIGVIGVFIMYALGMSLLMITVSIASVYSRDLIQKKINRIMPYVRKISGIVLILAGLYLTYFWWRNIGYIV